MHSPSQLCDGSETADPAGGRDKRTGRRAQDGHWVGAASALCVIVDERRSAGSQPGQIQPELEPRRLGGKDSQDKAGGDGGCVW